MVICAYFVNNMCRFGPKCNNEHVNVRYLSQKSQIFMGYTKATNIFPLLLYFRLILKTDAEGVLNGNQWMLSGYSPFRDKPCMPNFIEDQSFEEIRLMGKYDEMTHFSVSQFLQIICYYYKYKIKKFLYSYSYSL